MTTHTYRSSVDGLTHTIETQDLPAETESNDLSQRVKSLVNGNLTKSLEQLILDSRAHMQELIEDITEKQIRIINETTNELEEVLATARRNEALLHALLERFSNKQRARMEIIDEAINAQTEFTDGLNELLLKLEPENLET